MTENSDQLLSLVVAAVAVSDKPRPSPAAGQPQLPEGPDAADFSQMLTELGHGQSAPPAPQNPLAIEPLKIISPTTLSPPSEPLADALAATNLGQATPDNSDNGMVLPVTGTNVPPVVEPTNPTEPGYDTMPDTRQTDQQPAAVMVTPGELVVNPAVAHPGLAKQAVEPTPVAQTLAKSATGSDTSAVVQSAAGGPGSGIDTTSGDTLTNGQTSNNLAADSEFNQNTAAKLATPQERTAFELTRADALQTTFSAVSNQPRPSSTEPATPQTFDLNLAGDKTLWTQSTAERLAWLVQKGSNSAALRLHPPHLGNIEVRISISNEQASIYMSTTNPEIREMLEQALPRLENLLKGAGLELSDAQVTDQGFDRFGPPSKGSQDFASSEQEPGNAEPGTAHNSAALPIGLVDTYA